MVDDERHERGGGHQDRDVEGHTPGASPSPLVTGPARGLRRLRAAGAATAPFVGAAGAAIGTAIGSIRELPGSRVRRVRRQGRQALPSLPELYPESRRARPVAIGLRTIDVADVRGTAVGGGDQRGGDFLPLREFRGQNWAARWQRLRMAQERMMDLPPIEVVKFGDGYWVVDGHNRVGLALYTGQVSIDASVTELVPPGGRRSEPVGSLATELESSRLVRGRVETEASVKGQDRAGDLADLGGSGDTGALDAGEDRPGETEGS